MSEMAWSDSDCDRAATNERKVMKGKETVGGRGRTERGNEIDQQYTTLVSPDDVMPKSPSVTTASRT